MKQVHFILFVADQARSTAFYSQVLDLEPLLDVPGMTEFELPGGAVLGLMPEAGIQRLLGESMSTSTAADGALASSIHPVLRAELYLLARS